MKTLAEIKKEVETTFRAATAPERIELIKVMLLADAINNVDETLASTISILLKRFKI